MSFLVIFLSFIAFFLLVWKFTKQIDKTNLPKWLKITLKVITWVVTGIGWFCMALLLALLSDKK